jgi:S1-C subfamily serine protease
VSDMDTVGMSPDEERPGPEQEQPPVPDEGTYVTVPQPPTAAPAHPWGEPLVQPSRWSGPPMPPPRRPRTVLSAVLAGLLLLSGGIGIGWGLTRNVGTNSSQTMQTPIETAPPASSSTSQNLSLQAIEARVDPAIVDIVSIFDPADLGTGSSSGSARRSEGAGTGMIVTSSGQVLTNNHVIEGSTSLKVFIEGRSATYGAKVIGADPTHDVALIQIEGVSGLPTVTLADASNLTVGQRVVAIGNALGRGGKPTATEGSITDLDQSITAGGGNSTPEHLTGLIQMDASISPGDSGGAVVNSAGQVVGMITASARVSRSQQSSNIGYAITVTAALDVVNHIRSGQGSDTIILGEAGFIGVEVQDLDAAAAARLGLNLSSGVLVTGVISGTPAAQAGLSRNVVITAVNGERIESVDALGPSIHAHKPGERIQVTWVDGNGSHTATVTLIAGPAV